MTCLALPAGAKLLLAGTEAGCVRAYKLPLTGAGAAPALLDPCRATR